jgi:endonuclease YncB( thermonuclease family)
MALVSRSRRHLPQVSSVVIALLVGAAIGATVFEVARTRWAAAPSGSAAGRSSGTVWLTATPSATVGGRVRIADIDTPEIFSPKCDIESELGQRAKRRLVELMNAGPIDVAPTGGPDEDRYGRKLRVITRDGQSLGQILVAEGLARRWDGARRSWC